MFIETISQFIDKATIMILAYIQDTKTGLAPDPEPTSVKLTILSPSGEKVLDAEEMVKETDLSDASYIVYEYYFHKGATADAMEVGEWKGEILVTDGIGDEAVISPGNFSFKVR